MWYLLQLKKEGIKLKKINNYKPKIKSFNLQLLIMVDFCTWWPVGGVARSPGVPAPSPPGPVSPTPSPRSTPGQDTVCVIARLSVVLSVHLFWPISDRDRGGLIYKTKSALVNITCTCSWISINIVKLN